jgi:hypothetical protein
MPGGEDLQGEVAFLARVAQHYARSSIVRDVLAWLEREDAGAGIRGQGTAA